MQFIMVACDATHMAVAGDDLQAVAMEDSQGGGAGGVVGDGGESCYTMTAVGSEERARIGRHPRWSRQETLILIEAKKVEEAKCFKVKAERERGIEMARANSDSKWLSISHFCERMCVIRSAAQCRKRWCNLSADYKRIRDWQVLRGKQSFWLMSNDVRKDNKLPGCFDREVFDSLDKSLSINSCSTPDVIFDSGRQVADDGLFSDTDHPLVEENLSVSAEKEIESPPAIECLTSAQGPYEERFFNEKFNVDGCEDAFEEEADVLPGRKKQKRSSVEDGDDFSREMCALLENSSRILTAHMDSQNLNCHLDRTQRKEHAESLVLVLGRLAQAVGKVAEKL